MQLSNGEYFERLQKKQSSYLGLKLTLLNNSSQAVQNRFFLSGDNNSIHFDLWNFAFTTSYITHYMKGNIWKSIIAAL